MNHTLTLCTCDRPEDAEFIANKINADAGGRLPRVFAVRNGDNNHEVRADRSCTRAQFNTLHAGVTMVFNGLAEKNAPQISERGARIFMAVRPAIHKAVLQEVENDGLAMLDVVGVTRFFEDVIYRALTVATSRNRMSQPEEDR